MQADIYSRKSSADGGKSVAQQDEECADGIAEHGWGAGRKFTDDNRSASRYATKRRESYEELVKHIASGDCEILALWETARGGRREVTYFELLELCREHGTKIYVFTHDRLYDLTRRSDWRSLAQEVIDSADLSGKISEGSQRGKRKIAMMGKPAGKLLFGYVREYDSHTREYLRQTEHPEQAPVIRRMAEAVLEGRSLAGIARELNTDGIPRPSGPGTWRSRDVRRYTMQPAYVCKRVHRGEVLPDVEADWPNILDMHTWRQCRQLLGDPTRLKHQGSDMKWMLTGIVSCGRDGCDGVLRPHRSQQVRRYACSVCWRLSVGGQDLDDFISEVVVDRLRQPDAADVFRPRTDDAAVQAAEAEAEELRRLLREYRALAKARRISPASFADFEADLQPQITAAERRVRELTAPAPVPELEDMDAADVAARWYDLPPRIQREVIRLLMRITVIPAPKPGARFSHQRLRESRYVGDPMTWGQHWDAEGVE